jgi:imidazolonepropionase-like amidohydrolase
MWDALVLGVTTIGMFDVPAVIDRIRSEHVDGQASQLALSAGILATVSGGHGTQYGLGIPTVAGPAEAQAFVNARLAEGSDFLKITYEDFRHVGYDIPKLSPETLEALIRAAHRRKRLAVVHVMQRADTRLVLAAGADGLVHTFSDEFPDPDYGGFAAARGAFVIPTLALFQGMSRTVLGTEPLDDPLLEPFVSPRAAEFLRTPSAAGFARTNFEVAVESVRRLHEAGVPVLAGSDAGNPGTADGATMHRELEMLVYAGLTPAKALAAATSAPAAAFRLRDRGRIAPGLRADLLLVNGNPAADVRAARDIAAIWQGGVRVSRAGE